MNQAKMLRCMRAHARPIQKGHTHTHFQHCGKYLSLRFYKWFRVIYILVATRANEWGLSIRQR